MNILLAVALVVSALATITPTSAACTPENCVPDQEVCIDALDELGCISTRDTVDDVRHLFDPCTCPPIP